MSQVKDFMQMTRENKMQINKQHQKYHTEKIFKVVQSTFYVGISKNLNIQK